jgi:hypothetical protein
LQILIIRRTKHLQSSSLLGPLSVLLSDDLREGIRWGQIEEVKLGIQIFLEVRVVPEILIGTAVIGIQLKILILSLVLRDLLLVLIKLESWIVVIW